MKAKNIVISTGLVLSAVLSVSSSAKAASFTSNINPASNPPKGNVFLDSVTQNSLTSTSFNFVNSAQIISNTAITPAANSGAASSDKGDNANNGNGNLPPSGTNNPTPADIVAYLGNNNLNNIIDTEDRGAFKINVFFQDPVAANPGGVDSLFFWERGGNSRLRVYALNSAGTIIGDANAIANGILLGDASNPWTDAGFSIDTTEIVGGQKVYSNGLSLAKFGLANTDTIAGLQLVSQVGFNGPDFKVIAANFVEGQPVPEPTTMLGLGSVAALALVRRRQMKKAAVK